MIETKMLETTKNRHFMNSVLRLLRPKQWIKNGIIFASLIFSGELINPIFLIRTFWSFIIFCFLSSSVYIINDILDKENDRKHPKKCIRPIASGEISVPMAIAIFIVTFSISMIGAFFLDEIFFAIGVVYFVTMLAYSLYLKKVPILDVMIISAGFVFRALAGCAVIGMAQGFSPWLIMCTILLSLFLALNKRKSEYDTMVLKNGESREVLKKYNSEMLKGMAGVVDSSTIMAYCLYVISKENIWMMLTIPFVIYGLFRYQYLSYKKGYLESPELVLLSDKPLLIDVILWIIVCVCVIYLF